jgi:hypothetical protein
MSDCIFQCELFEYLDLFVLTLNVALLDLKYYES